jgi:hypothetical protein
MLACGTAHVAHVSTPAARDDDARGGEAEAYSAASVCRAAKSASESTTLLTEATRGDRALWRRPSTSAQ